MANIKFSYSENVAIAYALEHYAQFSYPNLNSRITNKKLKSPLIAVLAKKGPETIGLAISSAEKGKVSEIISLKVKEDYRNQGIGKKLVQQSLKLQQKRGYQKSRIMFYEHWNNLEFVQSLIRSEYWSQPQPVFHKFEHHYQKNKQKILPVEIRTGDSYSFRSFESLDDSAKSILISGELIRSPEDEKFSFKPYKERFSEQISHVLLKNDLPIGWCIAVKASEDSIDHNLFIQPDHRKDPNLPIALISKNWIAQMKTKFNKAIWIIDAANSQMVAFMERKLPHLIDSKSTMFAITIDLDQG